MISDTANIFRIDKMGKAYVQNNDPSLTSKLMPNDIWLDPMAGTMKTWTGSAWAEMKFGSSAIMDDCITNRMLANDISAAKITAGILQSQEGSFYVNLESGIAKLLNVMIGGQVEGNVIAQSSNGLTRVRLRGKEGTRDVTAGLIFEQRDSADSDEWANAGQIYFGFQNRRVYCMMQSYTIGAYDPNKLTNGYNGGTADGFLWRSTSADRLRAAMATYHGFRLQSRETVEDSLETVPEVTNVIGSVMSGTSIVAKGIVTCTYQMNEIMRFDFRLRVETAGSGSNPFGISPTLLRQINSTLPHITPVDGGTLQVFSSSGTLYVNSSYGLTMKANSGLWTPAVIDSNGVVTLYNESSFGQNFTAVGTCFGKYDFTEE